MIEQENEPYQCSPTLISASKLERRFFSASEVKGFIRFLLISIIVLTSFCFASVQKKDSCVECHTLLFQLLDLFRRDHLRYRLVAARLTVQDYQRQVPERVLLPASLVIHGGHLLALERIIVGEQMRGLRQSPQPNLL